MAKLTNSNFKMNATTKYILASITDTEARNIFKRNMIAAQAAAEMKPEPKSK